MLKQSLQAILLATSSITLISATPISQQAHDVSARQPDAAPRPLLPVQYYGSEESGKLGFNARSAVSNTHDRSRTANTPQKREPREPVPKPLRSTGQNGLIGAIYMCTENGFQGTCTYAQFDMATCYTLQPPFFNNISSFGPDQWAGSDTFRFQCSIHAEDACSGRSVTEQWPGTPNLKFEDALLDKSGKSVRCDFLASDAYSTWKAWKDDYGYDFNKYIEREGYCEIDCD